MPAFARADADDEGGLTAPPGSCGVALVGLKAGGGSEDRRQDGAQSLVSCSFHRGSTPSAAQPTTFGRTAGAGRAAPTDVPITGGAGGTGGSLAMCRGIGAALGPDVLMVDTVAAARAWARVNFPWDATCPAHPPARC